MTFEENKNINQQLVSWTNNGATVKTRILSATFANVPKITPFTLDKFRMPLHLTCLNVSACDIGRFILRVVTRGGAKSGKTCIQMIFYYKAVDVVGI